HYVLNAKNHEREAEFVAQAGRFGGVTISTNMAGRGTDIVLGGNPEFMAAAEAGTRDPNDEKFRAALEKYRAQCLAEREQVLGAGGLHILGTERHESRRIDNQLRGRSGRQGDPGSSRFFLSLEDDLLRIFGADKLKGLMGRIGMEDGVPIDHRWISKAIENAQKKVEPQNFDIRKHLLEYDDVMNRQREVVYHRRKELLSGAPIKDDIVDMCDALIEKIVILQTLGSLWKDHLLAMDHLKESIGLRGYAQLNPLVEYQKEGFSMFEALMATMQMDVVEKVFSVQTVREQSVQQLEQQNRPQRVVMSHGGQTEQASAGAPPGAKREAPDKVGRNDPCPCGSGKKYKRCHGK